MRWEETLFLSYHSLDGFNTHRGTPFNALGGSAKRGSTSRQTVSLTPCMRESKGCHGPSASLGVTFIAC
jgi:hypothetical protein